ncbi:MAG: hypoxanthine phosphoribosyltransferase [Candidatus Promineifilaceae bacterium]|jgi:hypoxanthine phosphoribosyltransferase
MSAQQKQQLIGTAEAISEIILSEEQIRQRVKQLGALITSDFAETACDGEPLVIVGVLKGVMLFLADLLRELQFPVEIYFIDIASHSAETRANGFQQLDPAIGDSIEGKHVLFVEDIVDAGLTLSYTIRLLGLRDPKSISVCTLLSKESKRMMDIDIRYIGFEIPPLYVVGYGLDHNELYRNLPFIGVLK